jgi:hypothetical protein
LEMPSVIGAVKEFSAAGVPPGSHKCPGSLLIPEKVVARIGVSLEHPATVTGY